MNRLEELIEIIKYHNNKYYNEDNPEIDDNKYDALVNELKDLCKKEGIKYPFDKVSGEAKREIGKLVRHKNKMLSLNDVFNILEVEKFEEDVRKKCENVSYFVEPKIDGLSLMVRYNNGKLDIAVTRGDGIEYGEDVTVNAKEIVGIKEEIDYKGLLEVRGEVYLPKKEFERINEELIKNEKKPFMNPRNAAAGTLRQLDPNIVRERKLKFLIFNIQECEDVKTHLDGYNLLEKNNLPYIKNIKKLTSISEIETEISKIEENRDNFEYEIDGAVVKVNEFENRKILGETAKTPKWAVAYKYTPKQVETKLLDIEMSVGRTGRITPTAVFEPVLISGSMVKKATLHNQEYINNLNINIGDIISVYKSGDIIPKVDRVVKKGENTNPYEIKLECPVCKSKAIVIGADIFCDNDECEVKKIKNIINFVSKDAMYIKGFGDKYIEKLVKLGYINTYEDIYTLKNKEDELIEQGIIGREKNTKKLLTEIENSKNNENYRLLLGVGIKGIGKSTAKELMLYFKNIDNLMKADKDEILNVNEVGEILVNSIIEFREKNRNIVEFLIKFEKELLKNEEVDSDISNKLENMKFVITGTFENYSRDDIKNLIEKNSGKVLNSISKKVDYLIAGEKAGSKLEKAKENNIKIINLKEFMNILY